MERNKLTSLKTNIEVIMVNMVSIYNPGHNILVLYNILVEVQFSTSKTKLDI